MSLDDRIQSQIDILIKSRAKLRIKIQEIDEKLQNLDDIKTVVIHQEQKNLTREFDKDGKITSKIEEIPRETKPPKNRYSGKEFTDEERETILKRIET